MNDDTKLQISIIWGIVLIILTLFGSCINSDLILERMIKEGTDPIKARCAVSGFNDGNKSLICMEVAKK